MALPHNTITPIPDTEPDAVPSLWNVRYEEIDDNFQNLDSRVGGVAAEVVDARGGKSNLDSRLTDIEKSVEGLDPDFQNALIAQVSQAMDLAGVSCRELERTKQERFQEGVVTMINRGVVSGCDVTISASATRNLHLAAGVAFMRGRKYCVLAQENCATCAPNPTAAAAVVKAYLYLDAGGVMRLDCTDLDAPVPAGGVEMARIMVPAGSTEATDPYLANCTLTITRRVEPQWPMVQRSPVMMDIALPVMLPDTAYAVHCDIEACAGGRQQIGEVFAGDKLQNGFRLYLAGAADDVRVRYVVSRVDI